MTFLAGLGLAQVGLAVVAAVFLGLMLGMVAGLGFLAVLAAWLRKRGQ